MTRPEELRIHALGAAISRRDWHAVEVAHASIRDAAHAAEKEAQRGPQPNPEGEKLYVAYQAKAKAEAAAMGGDETDLATTISFVERWLPDTLPVSAEGKVHFARALTESLIDAAKAHLAKGIAYPPGVTSADHIAHDMRMGRFPGRSSIGAFLAERITEAAQDQANRVMPLIGSMLDALDGMSNDERASLRSEHFGFYQSLRAVADAMEAK